MPSKQGGFVAWRGQSRFTGDQIVIVITQGSTNSKTGDMDQSWIILQDVHPFYATRTGADAGICSTCRHRSDGAGHRSCYVTVQHGPAGIWRALQEGRYPDLGLAAQRERLRGRNLRFGAYGDPTAAPFWIWCELASMVHGWTGYTHFWSDCSPEFKRLLMASVDTEQEAAAAQALGWRTFRVRQSQLLPGEIVCPASEEAGHRTTCERCRLCGGTAVQSDGTRGRGPNIAIYPHGPKTTFYRTAQDALFHLEAKRWQPTTRTTHSSAHCEEPKDESPPQLSLRFTRHKPSSHR